MGKRDVVKSVNLAEIDPTKLNIVNEEDRIFKGFLSVEIVDKQGDIVPIEELEKVMTALMKRGGVITDTHTNRVVGKILNWQKVIKDGKPAILITGQIFKDYKYDDLVWEKIKNGEYRGLSIGGIATQKKENGVNKLEQLELFEVSVCETPANPEAVITAVNTLAKADTSASNTDPIEDVLLRLAKALAEAQKSGEFTIVNKPDDLRPPKERWDRCVEETGSRELCGWVYYHHLKPESQPDDDAETREARERKRKWLKENKAEDEKECGDVCVSDEVVKDCKDRYLVKEPGGGSHFKEMTCPDDPSSKSRFCGCVRYQMSCNGKSLESAKKICAFIKRMKYGKSEGYADFSEVLLIKMGDLFYDAVVEKRYPAYFDTIANDMFGAKFSELDRERRAKVLDRVLEEFTDWIREYIDWLIDTGGGESEKDKSNDDNTVSGESGLDENINKQEGEAQAVAPPNGSDDMAQVLAEIKQMLQEILSKLSASDTAKSADEGVGAEATAESPPPGNPPKPEKDEAKEKERDVKLSEDTINAIAERVLKAVEEKLKAEPVKKNVEVVKSEAPPVVDETAVKTTPEHLTPAMIIKYMHEGKDVKKLFNKYFG